MKKYNHNNIKNLLLVSMPIISQIKTIFYYNNTRVNWWILPLSPNGMRIDFAVFYYTLAINFIILAYCLLKPKGVIYSIKVFIFIITVLDLLHLLINAGRNYGIAKIGIALLILYIWKKISER